MLAISRQILALAILFTLLLLLWKLLAVAPYNYTLQSVEALNNSRFELFRLQSIRQEMEIIDPQKIEAKKEEVKRYLFSMDEKVDRSADVIKIVDRLIRKSNVKLLNLKPGPVKDMPPFTRYSVKAVVSGSEENVAKLLREVEKHQPILIIDRAAFHSRSSLDGHSPEVSLELSIFGLSVTLQPTKAGGAR